MSMSAFARDIAYRMHHRACLIERGYNNVAAELREIALLDLSGLRAAFETRQLDLLAQYGFDPVATTKPFAYSNGTAIIPIHGLLVNRMSWGASFATGYDFIRSQSQAAVADPEVKSIIYDVNSSGGLATGCAELGNVIYGARGKKPSLAVVDARCYSAAYWLASACDRVVVTPSGGVGSIGCAAMHVDLSKMLEDEGIKVTYIYEGAEKVDGNSFEPLSTRARESIQRDVSYHYSGFVEAVARNRGLSEDDVRATEARCYLPPEALELGLIDAIATPAEAVAEFSTPQSENAAMTTEAPAVLTAEDVARMVTEGVTQGIAAERSRAGAIRSCEEAKGREGLAAHLADNTTLSIDDARAILLASPLSSMELPTTRQEPSGFAAAMDRSQHPNVGADPAGEGTIGNDDPGNIANMLLANYTAVSGRKVNGLKP